MIQQYLFQQMHNLIFIYDKLGLHVSAYQAIIRAPIYKNTENTASQSLAHSNTTHATMNRRRHFLQSSF
jgi:hypothetical protein